MKLLLKISKAILIIALTVVIIGFVAINMISSTILNESYVLKMLQSKNYYSNIYNEVQSNFESYIGPSGLDENILTDICTVEDVQNDTETILGNIYEGTNNIIDAKSIKEKALKRIDEFIQNENVSLSVQKNIEQFVDTIVDEYINTISHTEYEQKINDAYKIAIKLTSFLKTVICIGIIFILVALVLLNIKQIYRALSNFGIAITSSGVFLLITNLIINTNVRVQNIKILNDSISAVIQGILTDILNKISSTGIILAIVGVILIIVGNMIYTKNTEE